MRIFSWLTFEIRKNLAMKPKIHETTDYKLYRYPFTKAHAPFLYCTFFLQMIEK